MRELSKEGKMENGEWKIAPFILHSPFSFVVFVERETEWESETE
jgi:hypothetical protein